MCTLTWFRHEGGYELFFNRDELSTRASALGLRSGRCNGLAYVAPIDGEAGGTWLGVNSRGVTVALLNRTFAPVGEAPGGASGVLWRSRGRLALDVLGARSIDSIVEGVRASELGRTRPFTLVALEPERRPLRCAWDGEGLDVEQLDDEALPITSAPVPAARVARSAAFDALRATGLGPGVLERYHASHVPERGPLSVCLHGEHSSSRSLGHVRVTAGRATLRYRDRAPCEGGPDEVGELDLEARG